MIDPQGPMAALNKIGIDTKWIGAEIPTTHNGQPQWLYSSGFLSTRAIRDLAHLVVDGWNVYVKPAGQNLIYIQIKKGTSA